VTIYLVHDFYDPIGRIISAPGFYFEEVGLLSKTITDIGYEVVCINGIDELCRMIITIEKNAIVFNIVSGSGSRNREALVPALCESHGLNYIGSDAFGTALPMHKFQLKLFVNKLGVNIPNAVYFDPLIHDKDYFERGIQNVTPPYIIKPNHENMSRGVKMFKTSSTMYEYANEICRLYNQACIVEEYIEGKELALTLVGTGKSAKAFSAVQYSRKNLSEVEIFDGKLKEENDIMYTEPDVSEALIEYIKDKSLIIHKGLGLKDFSRADWRVNKHAAYFLEITPLPCLAVGTEFHYSAKSRGITFKEFIEEVIVRRQNSSF